MRILIALALLVATTALVACGGDDGGGGDAGGQPVASDANVDEVLDKTFSGEGKKIDSGKFALKVDVGGSAGSGTIDVNGVFQSRGDKQLPITDTDLTANFAGQEIEAGIVLTESKAFVGLKLPQDGERTDYAVPDELYKQFQQQAEQAASQAEDQDATSFAALGLDPKSWLADPEVAGESSVEGTDTVKVTSGVDVKKMLEDINGSLDQIAALGGQQAAGLPSELTPEQIDEAVKTVKEVSIELEPGKDDSVLRRVAFKLMAADPAGSGETADMDVEFTLSGVNEDQSVEEPSDTQPIDQLLQKLPQLNGLGALGGLPQSGGATTP